MSFLPEIKDDAFYYGIINTVKCVQPKTIIEIGSANGLGSTQAFIKGIDGLSISKMYCYEIDPERFAELVSNTANVANIVCFNGTFTKACMTDREVQRFIKMHPELSPAQYGLAMVLGWKNTIDKQMEVTAEISLLNTPIEHPCVALVDGSPFSGLQETEQLLVMGVEVIMLDDIRDIKNYDSFELLRQNRKYRLVEKDERLRNGYAIFEVL